MSNKLESVNIEHQFSQKSEMGTFVDILRNKLGMEEYSKEMAMHNKDGSGVDFSIRAFRAS